jgi:hypothetical protein
MTASNHPERRVPGPDAESSLENEQAEVSGVVAAPADGGEYASPEYGWIEPPLTSLTPVELRQRRTKLLRVVVIVLVVAVMLLLAAAARAAARAHQTQSPAAASVTSQNAAPTTVDEAKAEPTAAETAALARSTKKSPSGGSRATAPENRRGKAEPSRKAEKIRVKRPSP